MYKFNDIKSIQNKSLSTCHNFILLDYNTNCLIAALFIDTHVPKSDSSNVTELWANFYIIMYLYIL